MTPETERLSDLLPTTPDGREERLAELRRLFPDLFTDEGRLDPGELRRLVEPGAAHEAERYEFKWYGKAASKREAFTPTTATLVYDEARSVNPEEAGGNLIIEGENLEVLKLLLNAYREKVKCFEEKEAAHLAFLDGAAERAVFDEVLLKNGFRLDWTRERRDDFPANTVYRIDDGEREALVCLAWSERLHESTLKRLRELGEGDDPPFFICLERSLDTTAKWNLKHLLGKRFVAF